MSPDATSEVEIGFITKKPGRCGGDWTVGNSRITRGVVRWWVRYFGMDTFLENYPWIRRADAELACEAL